MINPNGALGRRILAVKLSRIKLGLTCEWCGSSAHLWSARAGRV